MRTMTAGQLRARLGEALDRASAGERIGIERGHRLLAAIVPLRGGRGVIQPVGGRSRTRGSLVKPVVIDASAALAYLTGEPDAGRVEGELGARSVVLVPWVFWSEVINVLRAA